MVYYDVPPDNFNMCFRRLNSTHQIGCSTSDEGETGFTHLIRSERDIKWLGDQQDKKVRFIVLLNFNMPNFSDSLTKIVGHGKRLIAGVLINHTAPITLDTESYSPDLENPNKYQSIYNPSDLPLWNPSSVDLLFRNLPFPIAILTNLTDVQKIEKCYMQANVNEANTSEVQCPHCAVNMRSLMYASTSSSICFRRSYTSLRMVMGATRCDPLGNYNLLSTLHPWPTNPNTKFTIILARMDSASLFEQTSPGLTSSIASFITLYTIMGLFRRERDHMQLNQPILFALFNGETFNYMGSSKLVHDLNLKLPYDAPIESVYEVEDESGEFLKDLGGVKNIDTMIELGHMFHPREYEAPLSNHVPTLFLHHHDNNEIKPLLDTFAQQSDSGKILINTTTLKKLPPSSIQPFLYNNNDIKAIYLSNFHSEYVAKFLNSFADTSAQFNWYNKELTIEEQTTLKTRTTSYITSTANVVACSIYQHLSTNTNCSKLVADEELVSELMYCFSHNNSCSLFLDLLSQSPADASNLYKRLDKTYVGVLNPYTGTDVTFLHKNLFVRTLGDEVDLKECSRRIVNKTSYSNQLNNHTRICYRHHTYQHQVYSPNIPFTSEDMPVDAMLPGWAESVWDRNAMTIKLFIKPCFVQELKTLFLGVGVLLVTLLIALFVHKILLKQPPTTKTPSETNPRG